MPPTTETVHLSAANSSAAAPVDFVTATTTRHSGATTSGHSERNKESLFDCGIATQISTRAPLSC